MVKKAIGIALAVLLTSSLSGCIVHTGHRHRPARVYHHHDHGHHHGHYKEAKRGKAKGHYKHRD